MKLQRSLLLSAAPVIAALGKTLPPCEVTIDTLSLVVQGGPEPAWDWHRVGDATLGTCPT